VLSLLRDLSVRGRWLHECFGFGSLTRWQSDFSDDFNDDFGGPSSQRFEIEAQCNQEEYRYVLVTDTWKVSPRRRTVTLESVECGGKPVFRFEEGTVHLYNDRHEDEAQNELDWERSALATIQERRASKKLTTFKRWLGGILHVQVNPWRMRARSEQEATNLATDLSNFADWYRHQLLDNGSAVQRVVTSLKQVIPGLQAIDAKEAGQNVRVLQATIRSTAYDLDDLSEGQRVLIALFSLLHCALVPDATLLIDEPDNFIALAEIQPWLLALLDRVDEVHGQVILVSHHPELVNQLASEGGLLFDRPEQGATRVRPFPAQDDSGLTPGELIARGWELA
jgi:predicted ATPase